jgi:signal transduction histidine kinase
MDLSSAAKAVINEAWAGQPDCLPLLKVEGDVHGMWDRGRIEQLLQNLIGNGLKFQKPGETPLVKVGAESVVLPDGLGAAWRITVEDNGIGFDEKYSERIFQIFQRLHGRSEYEGTGIGLAICRKIVERHGGTITANSSPGAGAKFVITLPQDTSGDNHHE